MTPLNTPVKAQIKAIAASLGALGGYLLAGFLSPMLPISADMEAAAAEGLTLAFELGLTGLASYLATWFAPRNAEA